MTTMASRTTTTRRSGPGSRGRRQAPPAGTSDEEDLLGGVGRRGDGVGGEDGEGDRLGQPLVLLLGAGERAPDEQPLQAEYTGVSMPLPTGAADSRRRPGGQAAAVRLAGRAASVSMRPMHVVVVGCGRVGTELAVTLEKDGHTVAVIDKNGQRLPPPARGLRRARRSSGFGFDRDHLEQAGIERGRRPGRGHQRRQLQHPHRPDRPGDLRDRARGRPHLRPPPGRRSTSASASPRSPPWPGPPTRCCAGCSPSEAQAEWTDATGTVSARRAGAARRLGGQQAGRARRAGPLLARRAHPARRRPGSPTADLVGQEGDILHVRGRRRDALDALRPSGSRPGRTMSR